MIVTDSLDTRRRRIDGDLVTDQLDVALMKVGLLLGTWVVYSWPLAIPLAGQGNW